MLFKTRFITKIVFLTLLLTSVTGSAANDNIEKPGSWFYKCKTIKTKKLCALRHVQLFKNKSPALTLTIFEASSTNKIKMHYKVPLGVYLPDGLHIKVDSGQPRITNYLDCNKSGCNGVIDFNEDEISALINGDKMRVKFTHQRGRKAITLNVPLDGAHAGIAKIRKPNKTTQKKDGQKASESSSATSWIKGLFSSESE